MSQRFGQNARSGSKVAFILLEAASFVGILGGSMVFMLLPWTAVNLAHSSLTAGIMISLSNIPGLVLSPLMGSAIDRFGRRRMAIIMQFVVIFSSLAFPLTALFGWMNVPALIILAMVRGLVGNAPMSARKALLPDVVAGSNISLEKANGLHESIAAGGFAIGPALASVLIGAFGTFNTFYVVASFELVAGLIAMAILVHEHHEAHEAEEKAGAVAYILTGFKTVSKVPSVLILLLTFAVLATVYLPTEMVVLPNYYSSIHDAKSMGFLLFDMAIFTMVGSFLFERIARYLSYAAIMRWAILLVAGSMIPMAFLPPSWVMFVCGAVLGLAWGPLPPLVNVVVQRKIPANQRGRVFSLEATIWTGGPMISMGLVGWGVDALGVRLMYPIIAGAVVVTALILSTRKSVKDLNTADYSDDEPPTAGMSSVPSEVGA
ncbi:MAG: MFS transporter [Actinomycetales bacterium]|nr:MFS transporter [Actinomycetales bacterium]